MPRDTEGYRIEQTWDVLGMRATRSDDTILDGVFVPDRYVVRVVPAGAAGIDAFVLGLFAWALLGFGNIYYGLARRALDLTIEAVKSKRSIGLTRPMAYHAELQHRVAQMGLAFESIGPHLDRVAEDWSNGVDHGAAWPAKIFAAKFHAVEESWRVVDLALEVAGGFGIFRKSGLEQLFRDARLGRIHPANSMLTHEIVGQDAARDQPGRNAALGLVGLVLHEHRRIDLERDLGDAVGGQTRPPRVFANRLDARGVVLAVDLAFDVRDVASDPAHVGHAGERGDRSPAGRRQLFTRETRNGSFDDVTGHWFASPDR